MVLYQQYTLKAFQLLNIVLQFNFVGLQFIIGTAESVTDNLSIQVENHALGLHEQVFLFPSLINH